MATILNRLRSSGGTEVIHHVIELRCEAWASPIALCNGYRDLFVTTEDEYGLEAKAVGMDVALPKKDATGSQSLRFALDNVLGEVTKAVKESIRDGQPIQLIYRPYTSNDLSAPADNPLYMEVRSVVSTGSVVEITAGFFDLIDTQFPRQVYNSEFAPGLKYLD